MSAKSEWIVFLNRDQVAVGSIVRAAVERTDSLPVDRTQPSEAAAVIARLLDERGHAGQPVVLALGSSDVVSATVAIPSRKALKRTAMAFLVEPVLPWSAEDSVIDYERAGNGQALVVAAEASPLRELITALQERGILVASVSPLARLALEQHLEANASLAPRYALVWGNPEATVDLWLIENNRPVLWRWVHQQLPSVTRELKQIALCEADDFLLVGRNIPDGFLASLGERAGLETRAVPPLDSEDPFTCGARHAAAVLRGRRDSPIELCRDQLAPADRHRSIRRELRLFQSSLVLLMVVVGLAAGFKGYQIEALRAECETREAGLFRSLFPKEKVPVAVTARLQSEVARLKGIRGESTDLPQLTPYVNILERVLKALPDSLRFRLVEVRITNGRLDLIGQVRAHGDADRIADGLRAAGLEVSSPNTHRLEKEGVEFRISAHLTAPPIKPPTRRAA
jgi:type II secretory pathway component PulL